MSSALWRESEECVDIRVYVYYLFLLLYTTLTDETMFKQNPIATFGNTVFNFTRQIKSRVRVSTHTFNPKFDICFLLFEIRCMKIGKILKWLKNQTQIEKTSCTLHKHRVIHGLV